MGMASDSNYDRPNTTTDENNTGRRKRTIMTTEQHTFLKEAFIKDIFPSKTLREEMGQKLNLDPKTIQIWFQNHRQRAKSFEDQFKNHILSKISTKGNKYVDLEILAEVAYYEYK